MNPKQLKYVTNIIYNNQKFYIYNQIIGNRKKIFRKNNPRE